MFVWLQVHTPTRHSRISVQGERHKARIPSKMTRTSMVQEALGTLDAETRDDNLELHVIAGLLVRPQTSPAATTYITPAVREVVRYWEAFIGEITPVIVFQVEKVFLLETPILPWFKALGVCNFVMGPHIPPRVLCEVTDATCTSLFSCVVSVVEVGKHSSETMTVQQAFENHQLAGVPTQGLVMTCPSSHAKLLRSQIWTSYALPLPSSVIEHGPSLKSRWLTDGLGLSFLKQLSEGLGIPSVAELRPQVPDDQVWVTITTPSLSSKAVGHLFTKSQVILIQNVVSYLSPSLFCSFICLWDIFITNSIL